MLEQDPHLLEEQRYLNRLKRMETQKVKNFNNLNEKYAMPELKRKRELDEYENQMIQRRI